MEELTTEQKAKAYDEAIEQAEKELTVCRDMNCDAARQIFRLFPQLAESEDERIRRRLIQYFSDFRLGTFAGIEPKKIIDWLEKQDEEIIPLKESILNVWELGNYWKDLTKGVCNTEHGTQLDYILKHWTEGEHYTKLLEKQGEKKSADKVELDAHKTAAWIEEDEKILQWIITDIERLINDNKKADIIANQEIKWLKSLRPQNTWKPSREQMMALRWVLNHIPYDSHKEEISGLLEQLKKLREE